MVNLPKALIGDCIDAVVEDRDRAKELLSVHPELINARWKLDEIFLHFLSVEGFVDGGSFLA